ncbi:zinc ABC transporter substrate-binding protein [Falsihalocynthiibacter arcticus]|uniref:High-affinity zinc uptake system protein ZnuA n=1 Tax=Falsihalocynthiibacter arcticus TaxID=1579316 RepID=A0A126UZS3_9RHOB|nr:zinc ABC transporter substrate-binding protein [Falsihalocynthiibacter arcticus]AML51387.1 hypothetical protein RC74_09090 [Falsihalocynthiibacter arcticus]
MKNLLPVFVAAIAFGQSAHAKAPNVVVDIAPIYAIAAQVMEGVGTPTLIVEQAASPHDFSLRPSHARGLQNADVVFSVSPDLTPWLVKSLETLAVGAEIVFLAEVSGTNLLEAREEEGHVDEEEHADEGGHAHGEFDPHSWLDPENAVLWAGEMARILTEIDPENGSVYKENVADFEAQMVALAQGIQEGFSDLGGVEYFVYHDAFQYFESRFEVPSFGAITDTEAVDPGPRRLQDVRDKIAQSNVKCLAVESGFKSGILDAITPNGGLDIVQMDPLGATLPLDKNLYGTTLANMAQALTACLKS